MASKKVTSAKTGEAAIGRLRAAGLRPTRQRVALAEMLFRGSHHHLTAESLHAEAAKAGHRISLATIYNALHQFTGAGLLSQVTVDAQRSYFDTNTGDHQHFYVEDDGELIDIPGEHVEVTGLPPVPKGMELDRVDVVVRIKRA